MAAHPLAAPGADQTAQADIPALLRGLGVSPYAWDIASDTIAWGGDPSQMLGWTPKRLATGHDWGRLLVPGSGPSRHELVRNASEPAPLAGAPFRGTYGLARPDGGIILVEDCGRWFAGPSGRPARVEGVIRRIGHGTTGMPADKGSAATPPLQDAVAALARSGEDRWLLLVAAVEPVGAGVRADAIQQRLRPLLRRGDMLLRTSDEEVAIILPDAGADAVRAAARRLADLLAPVVPGGAAFGVARIRAGDEDAMQVVQQASGALLRARMPGQGGLCLHRAAAGVRAGHGMPPRDVDQVVEALNQRRIALARRPVLSAGSRSVLLEDALPVMARRNGRLTPVDTAMAALEAEGLAALVEHRCLELALDCIRAEPRTTIRLPVSPAALACRSWHDLLAAGLAGQARMARRLIIDLDETCAAAGLPAAMKALGFVKEVGARVGISGYGRGLLTTGRVLELGADIVFIDGALITASGRSSDMRFLVRSVAESLHGCGRAVAGDWIADEDTALLAEDLGIDGLSGAIGGEPQVHSAVPAASAAASA
jgi:EAL domain-containing protein (putative c-di-GMP-specific phosphodiesterase class I)